MDEMGKLRSKAELEKKTSASFSLVYSRQGVRDTVTVQTNEQFMVDAVGGLVSYKETNLGYLWILPSHSCRSNFRNKHLERLCKRASMSLLKRCQECRRIRNRPISS